METTLFSSSPEVQHASSSPTVQMGSSVQESSSEDTGPRSPADQLSEDDSPLPTSPIELQALGDSLNAELESVRHRRRQLLAMRTAVDNQQTRMSTVARSIHRRRRRLIRRLRGLDQRIQRMADHQAKLAWDLPDYIFEARLESIREGRIQRQLDRINKAKVKGVTDRDGLNKMH
ncbi:MAG: hypothetical protein Q9184_001890 [Pyrenodesmia sp. 2 TL-2023]